MMHAPEMVPSLDDALRALDGFPGRTADVGLASRFLRQLDEVRDCPAVVLDASQAEVVEAAYLAGFQCADESGHVLVVSLPALLAYSARVAHVERPARCPFGLFTLAALLLALVAAVLDRDLQVAAWFMLAASAAALLESRFGAPWKPAPASWRDRFEALILHRPFLWLAVLFAIDELLVLLNAAILQGHSPLLGLVLVGGAVFLDALLKLRKKGNKNG